jgi:hypothetical protein
MDHSRFIYKGPVYILERESVVCPAQVEKSTFPRGVYHHDHGARGDVRRPNQASAIDAGLIHRFHQKITLQIIADFTGKPDPMAELLQTDGNVQAVPSIFDLDTFDPLSIIDKIEPVDGPHQDIRGQLPCAKYFNHTDNYGRPPASS